MAVSAGSAMTWQVLFSNNGTERSKLLSRMLRAVVSDPVRRYPEAFAEAERWPEVKSPRNFQWELIRDVPVQIFSPASREDYVAMADEDDDTETLDKYEESVELAIQGLKPPPILVDSNGMVLDGYHRLAALSDLSAASVIDVLWARGRK